MPNLPMAQDLSNTERDIARKLIETALVEDLDAGRDLTTEALIPPEAIGAVNIVARDPGIVCGNPFASLVFDALKSPAAFTVLVPDGAPVDRGQTVAKVAGPLKDLLIAERTALNLLTMLSGIATTTRSFVDAVAGTSAQILDTRKTLPGLRALQKYAVRCGGGTNHRFGLFDAVLIKDNHLAWWVREGRAIADAVRHARRLTDGSVVIEIEVDSIEQFEAVLPADPDIVLLDNMPLELLCRAVEIRNAAAPRVLLEASGGVNLQTVRSIALTGVDRISVGALTHSARALDIGFDWQTD